MFQPEPQPIAAAAVVIGDTEHGALFAPIRDACTRGAVLAVSGGSDSMALLHLFARWLAQIGEDPARFHVATIDHALRPGSAEDAAFVMQAARALGLQAHLRRWEGVKPDTGLPEAARAARYRLLADVVHATDAGVLLTAHTADDQAETLLMRLARGSGIDGLSGMAPQRPLGGQDETSGTLLARPLLGVERHRLRAYLAAQGVAWCEDPTNADTAYERVRLRQAGDVFAGLGLTAASLGRSARRLRRASAALEAEAHAFFTRDRGGRLDPLGLVEIQVGALLARPDDLALRILRLAIAAAGGAAMPISLASLEDLLVGLRTEPERGWTLARAALRRRGATLLVEREPGRQPLPVVPLVPGQSLLWDGRFRVSVGQIAQGHSLGPLGPEGLARYEALGHPRPGVPARTLHALPAIWSGNGLVAVPSLDCAQAASVQLVVHIAHRGLPGTPV